MLLQERLPHEADYNNANWKVLIYDNQFGHLLVHRITRNKDMYIDIEF